MLTQVTHPQAYYNTKLTVCQGSFENFREQVASWLTNFNWDWWATFTFRYRIHPYSAKKCFTNFFNPYHLDYFYVAEWFANTLQGVHIHALMGNTYGIRRLTTMDKWSNRYGWSRIFPYDSKLGARYYVCKYVTKKVADWDIEVTSQNSF
jgi:hypothetical protein